MPHSRTPPTDKAPPPQRRRARRWVMPAILLGAAAALGGLVFADWYSTTPVAEHPAYVGRQSCIKCHQQEAQLYHGSHHDLAMDLATAESVLGDFSGVELEHFGTTSRMYKEGERFMIRTEGPDGKPADFEVRYVLGVDPLQNYMVEFDRPDDMPEDEVSRVQVLRVTWDTRAKKWFYLPPPDVHDKLAPDDELNWCGITQRWNTSCADCHSTNLQKNFNEDTLRYHTTFSEIDVSCEACHGPGETHVKLAESKSLFWDRKVGYGLAASLKTESNENEVAACAKCHARRQVVAGDYDAGDNYWDHYSTTTLAPLVYQADGQIEDEVFEHGSFLQSKMYHKNIRCTDCHDPHSAKPKHEGNQLCTSCHQHPAGKYDTPAHHHHKADGKGASCVECHMPITNYMELHGRRDHSLRVPRPDLSVQLGVSNACSACHLDQAKLKEEVRAAGGKTNADHLKQYLHFVQAARGGDETVKKELTRLDTWAAEAVVKWYGHGPSKPGEAPHFGIALHAARERLPGAAEKLADIVKDRSQPAIVRATALEEWAALDDNAFFTASARQLADDHPLVRSTAAANLAALPMERRAALLAPLLEDSTFSVRRVAARSLVDAAAALNGKQQNQLQEEINAWVRGLMAENDRAGAHLAIGELQLALSATETSPREKLNRLEAAETAYRQAIRVEPQAIGARSQLAALLEALAADGVIPSNEHKSVRAEVVQLRDAEFQLLKRDVERAPHLAVVQFRYGYALLERREFTAALTALRKAAELQPIPEFRVAYVQGLIAAEQEEAALAVLREILKDHPENASAARLLRQLEER